MPLRPIPDPVILTNSIQLADPGCATTVATTASNQPIDLRQSRVDEFLMARSHSPIIRLVV
ncbi:hypothetical protein [Chroococcidiopsis sp.]|uniref:hypothetical protein n=1 Tax=Chroococcidiopsis sp. TaxID=3088168 RepID=UPI003F4115FC